MSNADDDNDESNDNNVRFFLRALIGEQAQQVRDAFEQLRAGMRLSDAVGVQIDKNGNIVVEQRQGLDDDLYKRLVAAKVIANRSSGMTEDLIAIVRLVVDDITATVRVINYRTANIAVRVVGIATTYPLMVLLVQLLRVAIGAGVGYVLEFALSPPSSLFRFRRYDDTFDADTGFRKFDDTITGRLGAGID